MKEVKGKQVFEIPSEMDDKSCMLLFHDLQNFSLVLSNTICTFSVTCVKSNKKMEFLT